MPDNNIEWGQGGVNNSNDWGKAKANSTNNFGAVYDSSPSGDTNIAGGQPVVSITYSASAFCADASDPTPTIQNNAGAGTFSSTTGLVFISTTTGEVDIDASTVGSYLITYTDTDAATATFNLTINALPTVIVSTSAGTICNGESTTLTASGASTYVWNDGNTDNPRTVSPTTTTTFNATGTDSNGCTSSGGTTITVNALPTVEISGTLTYCVGSTATLTATAGLSSYLWSTGATTQAINVTAGSYTVTGTDSNGCSATSSASTVTELPLDSATVTYSAASYCQMPTGALAVDGYYPLYTTEAAAQAESSDGTAHSHTLSGTTYYMPNDGVTIYHGTYSLTTPAPTITGQSGTFTAAPLFTGLLDTYTGSEAAYSLRRLSSTYTGNLIRVTKKVSNVISTTDIGYNSSNELDTTALATFASGADSGEVRVDIWYDQSGNGNNVTQSSFTGCPYIYQSGSLITENSKPAIKNGGNIALETTNSPFNSQVLTSFMVNKYYTTSNYHVLLTIGNSNASSFRFFNNNNYGNWRANGLNINGTSGDLDIQNLTSAYNTTTNLYARYNGSQFGTASGTAGAFTSSEIRIGKNLANANQNFIGTYQEFIFYSSEQSSNMSGIETNINNYYSIY